MRDIVGEIFIKDGEIVSHNGFEKENSTIISPVYEVIRVEEGIPLFIEDHFLRLKHSFRLLSKELVFTQKDITQIIQKLVNSNEILSNPVKILFFEHNREKHIVAHFMKTPLPSAADYITGVKTLFFHKERLNPNAKVWNEDFRSTIIQFLEINNAYEAILINKEGFITEGSRSNIFFIKDQRAFTTPSDMVLPGITRKKVIAICSQLNVELTEDRIEDVKITEFDSAFLTGTSRKILPISKLDSVQFKVENKLMQQISQDFEKLTDDYIRQHG